MAKLYASPVTAMPEAVMINHPKSYRWEETYPKMLTKKLSS